LHENNPKLQIVDPIRTVDYSSRLGLRLGFGRELAVADRKLPEDFDGSKKAHSRAHKG